MKIKEEIINEIVSDFIKSEMYHHYDDCSEHYQYFLTNVSLGTKPYIRAKILKTNLIEAFKKKRYFVNINIINDADGVRFEIFNMFSHAEYCNLFIVRYDELQESINKVSDSQ